MWTESRSSQVWWLAGAWMAIGLCLLLTGCKQGGQPAPVRAMAPEETRLELEKCRAQFTVDTVHSVTSPQPVDVCVYKGNNYSKPDIREYALATHTPRYEIRRVRSGSKVRTLRQSEREKGDAANTGKSGEGRTRNGPEREQRERLLPRPTPASTSAEMDRLEVGFSVLLDVPETFQAPLAGEARSTAAARAQKRAEFLEYLNGQCLRHLNNRWRGLGIQFDVDFLYSYDNIKREHVVMKIAHADEDHLVLADWPERGTYSLTAERGRRRAADGSPTFCVAVSHFILNYTGLMSSAAKSFCSLAQPIENQNRPLTEEPASDYMNVLNLDRRSFDSVQGKHRLNEARNLVCGAQEAIMKTRREANLPASRNLQ